MPPAIGHVSSLSFVRKHQEIPFVSKHNCCIAFPSLNIQGITKKKISTLKLNVLHARTLLHYKSKTFVSPILKVSIR